MSVTYDRIVHLLVENFAVSPSDISPEATFEELNMDSLFLIELLLVFQSEFDVKVSDDSVKPTDTIARAAELIANEIEVTPS
ncbi:hypothetical protein N566_16960 [Streptomycetaceae bacterium MP113-05]|nr:hypothetical protein N566_16960 [Streptomycetaceae bacterium MP113-05]